MDYGFVYEGKVYTPNGTAALDAADSAARNKAIEAQEIDWLKTAPNRLFLYVSKDEHITTWLGTRVDTGHTRLGYLVRDNFGGTRQSVDCRIFGVRYVGWYYTSTSDYCRLRKAKRQ